MTLVVDISCPDCDRVRSVVKVAIGEYRCTDCGCEFTQADLLEE
ncbi:MAG: hypothetical protein ABEJ31_07280 [Haloarculaceae archaeon]